jgi:hypothetical protein
MNGRMGEWENGRMGDTYVPLLEGLEVGKKRI